MEKDTWNSYFIENTNILKNKLGITNSKELELAEQRIVLKKLTYLYLNPLEGNCNIKHFKDIHLFLFEDIYDFAGKIRTCTLAKNIYSFCEPELIEAELSNTIDNFNNRVKSINTKDELAFVIAPFYYDLIRIHPFREGNGRATREFIRETVENIKDLPFNVKLDYTKMDSSNLLLGTKDRYFYPSLLEVEFMKALVPLEKEKQSKKG